MSGSSNIPRLVDLSPPTDTSIVTVSSDLSGLLVDPALFYGSEKVCAPYGDSAPLPTGEAGADLQRKCLAAIDDALRANPSSGELWLFEARVLFRSGDLGDAMVDALRRSYRTTPDEGWIASERVLLD